MKLFSAAAKGERGQKAVQLNLAEQAIGEANIARESSVVLLSEGQTNVANVVAEAMTIIQRFSRRAGPREAGLSMLAFLQSQVEFWIALGALALIIELTVLGAGSFVLLFMGLGALATGALIAGDSFPSSGLRGGGLGGLS